jgi:probable HAF family extracellular repeat protein
MRRHSIFAFALAAVLALILPLSIPARAASVPYSVTAVAPLAGDNFSTAYALNNNGQVVGISANFNLIVPFPGANLVEIADRSSGILVNGSAAAVIPPLGTPSTGLPTSTPIAINDSGTVVGYSTTTANNSAFIDSNGVLTNLGATVGGATSQANAINDSGQVAGSFDAVIGDGITQGFLYNGAVQHLATSGDPVGAVAGINAAGISVGTVNPVAGFFRAATFIGSTSHQLGTLPNVNLSTAFAINSAGNVAGWSGDGVNVPAVLILGQPPFNQSQFGMGFNPNALEIFNASQFESGDAFLYNAATQKLTDLGTLGGAFRAGFAMNDSNDVVGMSLTSSNAYHAFLDNGVSMVDLNDLLPADSGWTLISANAINNSGEIAGFGQFKGSYEGFLLNPGTDIISAVPLPPAIVSGLVFLAGLAAISRLKPRRSVV